MIMVLVRVWVLVLNDVAFANLGGRSGETR
jgi:hypothetical protein